MIESNYLEHKTDSMGEIGFMKKLLKKRLNEKGLTLIELLAVIVILAIVAAIAIPAISNLIANQRDKAVLADVSTVLSAAKLADTAGDCNLDQTTATATDACNETTLEQYVDGVDAAATYHVRNVESGTAPNIVTTLTVSSSLLEGRDWNLNPQPTVSGTDGDTITEANLNAALD